tara:strand:- start:5265 stop:6593 length:1329 start_codon:yes stop_codon:yes gene_type:complete
MVKQKKLISSNYFYKSHLIEISKYIKNDQSYINIVNESSNIPDILFENQLKISENQPLENVMKNYTGEKFDRIILTDIFDLSSDLYSLLKICKEYLSDDGLLILTSINPIWHRFITVFEKLNLKTKSSFKSYIKPNKVEGILNAANFEKISSYNRLLVPIKMFGIGVLLNFLFNVIFPFLNLGIRNYLIYKNNKSDYKKMTKSILIPAKNEEGNMEELINRIPKFDTDYEIVIVCGESRDKTFEKSLEISQLTKDLDIKVLKQSKNGKANAIWEGLDICKYELIAILDSDLSVDPETLPNFFEIIESGNAEFVNGTRLIYKMEKGSMQTLNKFGNWLFQLLISKLISVKLTDSLCGTKVFKKAHAQYIKNWQEIMYFEDPFCDFDLIFSAAYSSNKILELPVHYKSRKYGSTNISRFRDGWKLIFYFINSYFLFKTSFSKKI